MTALCCLHLISAMPRCVLQQAICNLQHLWVSLAPPNYSCFLCGNIISPFAPQPHQHHGGRQEQSRKMMSRTTEAQKESRSGKIGKEAVSQEKKKKSLCSVISSVLHSIMQSSSTLMPSHSANIIITTELNNSITKM